MRREITVVGAGMVGASIAYYLARRGASVTILEAAQPAAGATGATFGWLNATFSKRPRSYFDLSLAAMAAWRRLEGDLHGAIRVQWCGTVMWAPPGPEADALIDGVRNHKAWGYEVDLLDQSELVRMLPDIVPGPVGAACFCANEGAVDAVQATQVLLQEAQRFGAALETGAAVSELDPDRGTFVLACGTGIPALAKTAGIHVPLKDAPGILVHLGPQPPLVQHIVAAPGSHFRQSPDGRIIAGGPVVAGAGTAEHSSATADEILEQAARYLPALRAATVERVTLGYRVMPADEYPIAGFAATNVYVAAMHSAINLAPLIGELGAREILDGKRDPLLEPYHPARFGTP